MKQDEIDEIWKKTCALLRDALAEVSYETWIAALKPLDIIDNRFLFEASTPFHKNMVTSRYSELIRNALRSATKRDFELEIYLPGENAGETAPAAERVSTGLPTNMLNPKYTFDTFVIGNSNRFAHAASLAVAESPADAYNPLFLYGGVGLGKTHLMHAIGHYMLNANPSIKLVYITSENFTNELISAIQNNRNTEFRERFRNVDVLMVDDIQFIAGRDSTQEEFFHTFNQLHASGKQIIISSDKPPRDIPTLEERLRSRFEWGLIADIQKPDYETRIAILRKKAQAEHIDVSDEIIAFIAEKIESNIREARRFADQNNSVRIAIRQTHYNGSRRGSAAQHTFNKGPQAHNARPDYPGGVGFLRSNPRRCALVQAKPRNRTAQADCNVPDARYDRPFAAQNRRRVRRQRPYDRNARLR